MAAAAVLEQEPQLRAKREMYAESLAAYRYLGQLMLEQTIERPLQTPEGENAFHDYRTSVEEGLITDEEIGDKLYFDSPSEHRLVDGRVVASNGQFMTDLVGSGAKASAEAATKDSELEPLAVRDAGDVLVAEAVDDLQPGEMLRLVSMDPKKQLTGENKKRWTDMGLRLGLAVEQVYLKTNDGRLLTWTIAIKNSSKKAISQIYREELDTEIPVDTDENLWSRYMHRSFATNEEVKAINAKIRNRHKQLVGNEQQDYSVTEFMNRRDSMQILQRYFETYGAPLSLAIQTGRNQPQLRELALAIYSQAVDVAEDDRNKLFKLANKHSFTDQDGRLMNRMLRYATIERMREELKGLFKRNQMTALQLTQPVAYSAHHMQTFDPQQLHYELAMSIQSGAKERRSYGGCAASSVADNNETFDGPIPRMQDIFGGNADGTENTIPEGRDGKGPLKFKCSKGHWNTRKDFQPLTKKCKKCKEDISCGEDTGNEDGTMSFAERLFRKDAA